MMKTKVKNAVAFMLGIANDSSHGYDQIYRWGERGDYDCSSLIITAFEQAGIPLKSKGATYTGNMKAAALKCGFKDVTKQITLSTGKGIKPGDILLNEAHHVALAITDNGATICHASINEKGKATGGIPGDQTGKEICTRSYYNKPWNCILRYTGDDADAAAVTVEDMDAHGRANVQTFLNVRSAPATSAQLLGSFAPGDDITITGKTSNGWYRCRIFGGQIGYVNGDYVADIRATATPHYTAAVEDMDAHGRANVSTFLNVRSEPSTAGVILGAFAPGDDITITGKTSNGWYRCRIFGGQIGYVSGDFVQLK